MPQAVPRLFAELRGMSLLGVVPRLFLTFSAVMLTSKAPFVPSDQSFALASPLASVYTSPPVAETLPYGAPLLAVT